MFSLRTFIFIFILIGNCLIFFFINFHVRKKAPYWKSPVNTKEGKEFTTRNGVYLGKSVGVLRGEGRVWMCGVKGGVCLYSSFSLFYPTWFGWGWGGRR